MKFINFMNYFPTLFLAFALSTKQFCAGIKVVNGCPEHFARVGAHCSTLLFKQMPYNKAGEECRSRGGTMFMVKDKTSYDQLLNASPTNATQAENQGGASSMPAVPGNLMMGLKYTASSKKWLWADGTEYKPASDWALWMNGSPPDPNKDGCVVWKKKGKDVKWDMADCNVAGFTICYAPATSKVQTCPDKYMQEDNMCIMIVMKLDSSFESGSAECKAAGGGNIAMLKEESQLKQIKDMGGGELGQLPVPVWMGLKYYASEGKWKWSDGQEYKLGTDWGLWKKSPGTLSADTCVTLMKAIGGEGFEWNTEECNAKKGIVVCSKTADADPTGESKGEVNAPAPGGGGGDSDAPATVACGGMVLLSSTLLVAMNWLL